MIETYQANAFRIAFFTRKGYEYKPGFWIPERVKEQLAWTGDTELGLIIFDELGRRLFDGALSSISGGEVYLKSLAEGQNLHIVAFLPANDHSFTGNITFQRN